MPVVGFCWWPVIPVMELSRIMTVELVLVVGDVGDAGDAGVDEGGVADHSHAVLLAGPRRRAMIKAVQAQSRRPPCRRSGPWRSGAA